MLQLEPVAVRKHQRSATAKVHEKSRQIYPGHSKRYCSRSWQKGRSPQETGRNCIAQKFLVVALLYTFGGSTARIDRTVLQGATQFAGSKTNLLCWKHNEIIKLCASISICEYPQIASAWLIETQKDMEKSDKAKSIRKSPCISVDWALAEKDVPISPSVTASFSPSVPSFTKAPGVASTKNEQLNCFKTPGLSAKW